MRTPVLGTDELRCVFALLDDESRRSVLAVCRAWQAAFAADPALWPMVTLYAPIPAAWRAGFSRAAEALVSDDTRCCDVNLADVARVPARAQRVQLCGFDDNPQMVYAYLAVLPASITRLELSTRCMGPLPAALQRFPALQRWGLRGNGAEVDWRCRGAVEALGKLTHLALDCRQEEWSVAGSIDDLEPYQEPLEARLPEGLPAALLAATRLQQLDVAAEWSEELAQLCRSVAGNGVLQELRLGVYNAFDDPWQEPPEEGHAVADAITGLLQELSQAHPALSLGLSADAGLGPNDEETRSNQEKEEEARQRAALRPLGGVPRLHELAVRGLAPPPDLFHLSGLRALALDASWAGCEAHDRLNWKGPWSALARLTRLTLAHQHFCQEQAVAATCRLPGALCALPALRALHVSSPRRWHGQEPLKLMLPTGFSRLTALAKLELQGFLLATVPPAVRGLTGLRVLCIDSPSPSFSLPPGPYLSRLVRLDLRRWEVAGARLPPALAAATALTKLFIGSCRSGGGQVQANAALLAGLPRLAITVVEDDTPGGLWTYRNL